MRYNSDPQILLTRPLSLLRAKPSQAGPYRVIVSNPNGSATSIVAVLTVKSPPGVPIITLQPREQSIRAGEGASFSVVATGDAPLTLQWYRGLSGDTRNPVGLNSATYTSGALTNDSGYWVSAANSFGSVDSDTAWVTVVPVQAPRLSFQILSGYPVITVDGRVGVGYVIQYKNSISETNWFSLLDFTLSVNPFTFFDSSAAGVGTRFYRAHAY